MISWKCVSLSSAFTASSDCPPSCCTLTPCYMLICGCARRAFQARVWTSWRRWVWRTVVLRPRGRCRRQRRLSPQRWSC
jgi:hypothetical protein